MTRSLSFQAVILTTVAFCALCGGSGIAQAQFKQTDLVSDLSGLAKVTDPNLINPWGVSFIPGLSPFWISNQGTGTSSLFSVMGGTGVAPANILAPPAANFAVIPPPVVAGFPGPTGQVSNPTAVTNPTMASFDIGATGPAFFIFANLNGSISAWNPLLMQMARCTTRRQSWRLRLRLAPLTPDWPSTRPAIGSMPPMKSPAKSMSTTARSGRRLSLADLTMPAVPAGLVPFNVEDIGGKGYVAYAPAGPDAQRAATAGMGFVAVFNEDGVLQQNLVDGGPLAAPWGMAIAPAGFGPFGGDLLVGNFSFLDSEINVFNASGTLVGTIHVNPGADQMPGGLWDLTFGGGGPDGDPNTLFITDGIDSETHGLFAALTVPEPSTWAMMLVGFGGLALFAARRRAVQLSVKGEGGKENRPKSDGSFPAADRRGKTATGLRGIWLGLEASMDGQTLLSGSA